MMKSLRFPDCTAKSLLFFLLLATLCVPMNAQTFTNASSRLSSAANGFEWGTSVADFNNDGWVDIYERGTLYINEQGLFFRDMFAESGLDQGSSTFGAVFGDYNDDGYLDIFFENFGSPSRLFRNEGNRRFVFANSDANVNVSVLTQTCGWADFNRDGTLDLFIDEDRGNNILLKNTTGDRFENISATAGVPTNGNSYGMSWGDFNNDGLPDVFIATCPGGNENHLLVNNGNETFTNIAATAGVNDRSSSWGNIWLDYNNDGLLDVYIANTSSDPNILYRNNGDGTFTDVSATAGVTGNGGFGCAAADFDNDGWIDIYAATSSPQHSLYRNNGDGTFTDIAVNAGVFEDSHDAVGLADFNNDGWMDIFTAGSPQNVLLINDGGSNHWIGIRTRGVSSNYYGVSSRIEVYSNGARQIRDITAGSSFCSQSDQLRPIFGLGSATTVDSIIVRWSTGVVDVVRNIDADQYITIAEGVGFNQSPVAGAPLSPLSGDSLSGANLRFSWSGAVNPEAEDLTYRIHLWGTGVDTLIQVINDTLLYLPGPALPGPGNYSWRLEVSDGYSLVSGFDIVDFYANPTHENFTSVTGVDISPDSGYSEGVVWSDFNNDGLPDIYVSNLLSQKNLYYVNDGGGFNRVDSLGITARSGDSYGATSGDFNGDGLPDLFVIHGLSNQDQNNQLFLNDGAGGFTEVSATPIVSDGGRSWSCSAIDFDRDGFLDIFVANYGQNNALYRNDGTGNFTKVTTGAVVSDGGFSLGNAWADYDLDGDPDLFVANANLGSGTGAANFLYRNNGDGTFTKITEGQIVTDTHLSVGGSWGDYDNDGDPDLFVTNYGGQNNALYRNNGDGTFTNQILSRPANGGGSSVGSAWGDYDNDGDLDLFVSNDLNENNFFYENLGNGNFRHLGSSTLVAGNGRSNGAAWTDFDLDGDLDLYVTNGNASPSQSNQLFLNNNLFALNGWISIRLRGTRSNRTAIGARVSLLSRIDGEAVWQTREISSQTGYNAQPSPTLHFGLGDAGIVDSMIIQWPSGIREELGAYLVNQFLEIREDSTLTGLGD
ncbi:MAG TPA: FG-GAP-like repeat-containing protein, partial [Calditrichia bacterium]|nr:FG-GAP-like repeat-containing protein [Calditrichia bacterium]